MDLQIKNEHKQTVIAFGDSGLPLNERAPAELLELAIMAQKSQDKSLTSLFVSLPDLGELLKAKTDAALKQIKL